MLSREMTAFFKIKIPGMFMFKKDRFISFWMKDIDYCWSFWRTKQHNFTPSNFDSGVGFWTVCDGWTRTSSQPQNNLEQLIISLNYS